MRACTLAMVLATTGGLMAATPAGATPVEPTGTVFGTVVDETGTPLQGITVTAKVAAYGTVGGSAITGEDGTYEITGVHPTRYHVTFSDPSHTYPTIYSGESTTWIGASYVDVEADNGAPASVTMPHAAVIEGTVKAGPLRPQNLYVVVLGSGVLEAVAVVPTDADGSYRAEVTPGDYKIAFIDAGIGATPPVGFRPQLGGTDLLDDTLATGYLNSPLTTVTVGEAATVDASVVGMQCDPDMIEAAAGAISGADLRGADLRGCDLHGMSLTDVDLSGATLSGADLSGTTMNGVDLTGADLNLTDLTDASMTDTTLVDSTGTPIGWASALYDAVVCPSGVGSDGNDQGCASEPWFLF
jgi:hypothetical protein